MTEQALDFVSALGLKLYARGFLPDGTIKAAIVVAHGLCEHSGRYAPFITHFTQLGYAVFTIDHEGHGNSEGVRGDIESFSRYVEALSEFIEQVRNGLPATKVFLVGHSMGGVISLSYLLRDSNVLPGCILSGAALATDEAVPRGAKWLIQLLAKILPRLHIIQLKGADVSRDVSVVKGYEKDPLVFRGRATARLLNNIFAAARNVLQRADEIRLPILVLHGSADKLAEARGSEQLVRYLGSTDKTLKIYPDLYHEIFLEPEKDVVYEDIADWLETRIQ